MTSVVRPEESLGRYLTDESYFSRKNNTPRPKAFMPPLDLRLSVFRIDGLKLGEIWELGQREVINAMPTKKQLYGIADIKTRKVQEVKLVVECDNKPPRHANIIGWPTEKDERKIIAEELAAESNLILKQ
ncbi:MAG: hypothetical protein PHN78_01385 [Dehalococcoidales bacterium]|nr:hypothetical protein [Dehalococcoidales bacterium]